MNKTVFAIFGTVLWGVFNTASAELTPFYEESADSWSCGYKNELGEVILPTNKYEDCGEFVEKYAYVSSLDEIKESDFNLNISRYVDTFEPEEINLVAVREERLALKSELASLKSEIANYLKELDYGA